MYTYECTKNFRFGLSKQIPKGSPRPTKKAGTGGAGGCDGNNDSNDDTIDDDCLFQLTPETGTLRYMSNENGLGQKYGWSADVYSLSILIHEILTLKAPFGMSISPTEFRNLVWKQQQQPHQQQQQQEESSNDCDDGEGGLRPPIDETWPKSIQELLSNMWNSNPLQRPSIEDVSNSIDSILRGPDKDLFPTNLVVSIIKLFK